MALIACIVNALRAGQRPFKFRSYAAVAAAQGLYAFWLNGKCLYVGESINLSARMYQHSMHEHNRKLQRYFDVYPKDIQASYVVLDDCSTQNRLDLEREAILRLRPTANITHNLP